MGLKIETRTIDGLQVRTQQLPALRAWPLFIKLGRIIGPALTKAADIKDISLDMDLGELAPAIGALFAGIEPNEAADLAREILMSTTVVMDNKNFELMNEGAIDTVFSGRFLVFMKTMAFAIQVNFQDFTDVVPGMVSRSGSDDPPEKEQANLPS